MKTWLKAFWGFLIEPWASALALLVIAIIMVLLLRFMFYLGAKTKEKELKEWQEQCDLCAENSIVRRYPCLINMGTGRIGELRVLDTSAEYLRETEEFQEKGVYSCGFFVTDRFATSFVDGEKASTSVTVPKEGYALADLYHPEHLQDYEIIDGASYEIRGCKVEVRKGKKGLTITVTKYLN